MMQKADKTIVIIGAGPAGLTAGYELIENYELNLILVEKLDKVGGIARTEKYKDFYFDMGGHRFFSKAKIVSQFWEKILGDDFLKRPRLSRIYYRNKFFNYPLKPFNAFFGLGPWQAILIVLSYLKSQIFPLKTEDTFEDWVTNRFGKRLFEIFFKTYTEKVWGVSVSSLKAEFAKQRIKDLNLRTAIFSMFIKPKQSIRTLIEEFHYPRLGPGMLWERVHQEIEKKGGKFSFNSPVSRIFRDGNRITAVEIMREGNREIIEGTDFISSMPVSEFIQKLDNVPGNVLDAARKLTYRDFLTVCLIVNKKDLFPDNWIYVHSPEVMVGRIQNFKNWSPDMVPDPAKSGLGLEYFCKESDEIWLKPDADLIELAKQEIDRMGLAHYSDIEDGVVYRVPKAYPIYDSEYRDYLEIVRQYTDCLENFQTVGRNGLHRYNNQDHSMITAMKAVRNIMLGEKNDLWAINDDHFYQEEIRTEELDEVELTELLARSLTKVFPYMDKVALGISMGLTSGVLLFLATIFLVLKGGPVIGPNLQLLNNFLPGYTVNLSGGVIGFIYAAVIGFICGWLLALLRNFTVFLSAMILFKDIQFRSLKHFLDQL